MLVEDMMKKEVVTLQPTASIADALQLLQNHRIRHIPIVNERNHVIGIVSDRDVRDASPSILDSSSDQSVLHNEIQTIMSQPVISVHPLDFEIGRAQSELQSRGHLVCRLLLEEKKTCPLD